jgi:hypothetical protein
MKKTFYTTLLAVFAAGLIGFTSCSKEDDPEPVPEVAKPTVSVTAPEIPTGGLLTEVGVTTTFTISLTAEAGLSTLKVNDNTIKTFTGTETTDEVTYDYLPLEAGNITLSFIVEDALGKSDTAEVAIIVEEGEDLGYLLIDFAGTLISTEDKTVVDWDIRKLFSFGVTGSHGTTATAEVVNLQAQLAFAQANPSAEDNAKVFKIEKVITDTSRDNWGGWAHVIFNLGSIIPEATISALPVWDNVNSTTVAGTKVFKVDAYYDATVDPNFTWTNLTALTDIWNADPTQGYKIDLQIASYDPMGIAESGHDGSFYMGYAAYIPEPNKWVTVTFNAIDEGRTGNMFGVAEGAPGADAIDCVKIMPSPGYTPTDANPLYLKNLRIVDVE